MNELDQALLKAADRRDILVITDLIERGADPNCKDRWGNIPISNASWKGHTEAMDLLVNNGADLAK